MVSIAAEREVMGLIPACHSKMQESEITQILAHVNTFCAMNEPSFVGSHSGSWDKEMTTQ